MSEGRFIFVNDSDGNDGFLWGRQNALSYKCDRSLIIDTKANKRLNFISIGKIADFRSNNR